MKQVYAGIDLHSNNNYLVVIDEQDRRLYERRLANDIEKILPALQPFKKELQGIAVESTFNWYWLVDALQDAGHKAHLVNTSAVKQYEGLKHTDDKWDSFWLAHMLRLGILPEGYIYPKEQRAVRDLLRRRLKYVGQRTAHILSLQSTLSRNLGKSMSGREIKKLREEDAQKLFSSPHLSLMAVNNIKTIRFLSEIIKDIEKTVLAEVKLSKDFQILLTIPGVGEILALTIMLEVGDIGRFARVGNYSSYCRCVNSKKISNNKKKGENNRKNGNKSLAWAYVEAANFANRFCPEAHRFHQKKTAKTNSIVATKALSNKLARASYYMLRDQVAFDVNLLFR